MDVLVRIKFDSPSEQDWDAMRSLARGLTDNSNSVRVSAGAEPGWLVAEFNMPTEAQYLAVDKIDRAIRWRAGHRLDSTIGFPKSSAQRERARRKAERRRARRKMLRDQAGRPRPADPRWPASQC
jgi:hypothetical protein